MTRLAWATDIHLDHCDADKITRFCDFVVSQKYVVEKPDALLLTGDISVSYMLIEHLTKVSSIIDIPIYFVLGNHDYWKSSTALLRSDITNFTSGTKNQFLTTSNFIPLSTTTALVGSDGWYDARCGDYKTSRFVMNDWFYIDDYVQRNAAFSSRAGGWATEQSITVNHNAVIDVSRQLAHDSTEHVIAQCEAAITAGHTNIVIATHFPPFPESHIYNGRVGNSAAQPWYTSMIMGENIKALAQKHPNIMFDVYAGHTHGKFDGKILSNVRCSVGGAAYGSPKVQRVIECP